MALDTKTIERLITDRTEDLPLEATGAISEISDDVLSTLSDIAVLKYLQSGKEQMRDYEARHGTPWNHAFRHATRRELRSVFHGTRGERFQRIFTPPDKRVVPVLPHGRLEEFPLDGFVVSPDRVQGTFLVKTGLAHEDDFGELNGDEIGRLVVKHDSVPGVVMLMEAATPIGPSQGRLLRVNMPSKELRERYPDGRLPKREIVGGILYVRSRQGTARDDADLQIHVFDGSYDALRKTSHADARYANEIDALAQCQRELDNIRSKLDRGYVRGASDEFKRALWSQAEAMIARSTTILRNAQAPEKVEARDFLEEVPSMVTRTGKPNVSPAMAKITAALRRISWRFRDIREKGGYNAEDRIILHENIRGDEWSLLTTRHDAIDYANDIDAKRASPHDARRMLELKVKDLEKSRVRPLSVFADAMIRHIQMLDPDNEKLFREQLLRLHVIGKIQGIRTSAERIRGNAAKIGKIDYASEARVARQVEDAVLAEQIYPGMAIANVEHVMEPLAQRWVAVRSFLEERAQTPPVDPEQAQAELEDLLDNLGTENAAEALVSWLPEARPHQMPYELTNKHKMLQ